MEFPSSPRPWGLKSPVIVEALNAFMGVAVGRSEPFAGIRSVVLRAPFVNYAYTREAVHVLQILAGPRRPYYVLENIEWLCRSIRERLPRGGFDIDNTYVRAVIFPNDNIHVNVRHLESARHIQYDRRTDHWYFRYSDTTDLRDW
jgi:hypothetical protein